MADCTSIAPDALKASAWPTAFAEVPVSEEACPLPNVGAKFPRASNSELAALIDTAAKARKAYAEALAVKKKSDAWYFPTLKGVYESEEAAMKAVPAPAELRVLSRTAVKVHFEYPDGSTADLDFTDKMHELVTLETGAQIDCHYQNDPDGRKAAHDALDRWQKAKSKAREGVRKNDPTAKRRHAEIRPCAEARDTLGLAAHAIFEWSPANPAEFKQQVDAYVAARCCWMTKSGALRSEVADIDEVAADVLALMYRGTAATAKPAHREHKSCTDREAAERYLCWLNVERLNLARELGFIPTSEDGQELDICIPSDPLATKDRDWKTPVSSRARAVLTAAGVTLEKDERPFIIAPTTPVSA